MPKRYAWQIYTEMLSQALNPKNKTRIMYACNLSYQQLNVHLSTLLEKGLIEAIINLHKHGTCSIGWYKTTERGMQFIEAHKNLESILSRGQKHEPERAFCKLRAESAYINKFNAQNARGHQNSRQHRL